MLRIVEEGQRAGEYRECIAARRVVRRETRLFELPRPLREVPSLRELALVKRDVRESGHCRGRTGRVFSERCALDRKRGLEVFLGRAERLRTRVFPFGFLHRSIEILNAQVDLDGGDVRMPLSVDRDGG